MRQAVRGESFPYRTNESNGMSKGLRTLWPQEHYDVQRTVDVTAGHMVRKGGEWGQVIKNLPQLG